LIQWQGLIKTCATAERMIKGAEAGDEWDVIEQICLAVCQPKLLKQGDLVAV
jgi:hypothetical protein